jgi:hypothetical protein
MYPGMYPDIYPTLPMRFGPDTYPTRGPHGYYPDMYPPNTGSLLLSALCRELYIQFKAHESSNTAPLIILEITNEIKITI